MALGRPNDALWEYDRLINLRVRDRDAHVNRAIVLIILGEDERAEIDIDVAIQLGADPDRLRTTVERIRAERAASGEQ